MSVLVTGCSGFIGFHLSKKLLDLGFKVVGIDNLNDYYDVKLKKDRNKLLKKYKKFTFIKIDITNTKKLEKLFKKYKFSYVVNLAAQAGVRLSVFNPEAYQKNNINGFFNIILLCKKHKIKKLLFASSSSIYGDQIKFPIYEHYNTDKPISFYAASKISNEASAFAFSKIYKMNIVGLRFFTVYGSYGRPDMAPYKFVNNIYKNKKIFIYNKGIHERDFTHIHDVVDCIVKILNKRNLKNNYSIFNICSSKPIKLMKFVNLIEKLTKKKIKYIYKPRQKGDVIKTYGSNKLLLKEIQKKKFINIKEGLKELIDWYKSYHKV